MAWWIWAIIALVVGIIEVSTFTFVLLWIAIAACITAILTIVITNIWVQLFLFVMISVILLLLTRPMARRWKQRRTYPAPNEGMPGKRGVVVTEAQPGAFATVRVEGDLWSARSEVPLTAGEDVVVESASATVLTVRPEKEGD